MKSSYTKSFAPRAFLAAGAMLASIAAVGAQDASNPLPPPSSSALDSSGISNPSAPGATNQSGQPSRDRNSSTMAPLTPSSPTPASTTPMASGAITDSSVLSRSDRSFVMKASKANSEEITISRVAAERATRPDVRAYAQELLSAHQTVDTGLSKLASNKSVMLEPVDADLTKKWNDKKLDDFDKDYVKEMVSAHKKAVDLFEDTARDAKDTEVATFAREQIATLNAHLRKAQDLEKSID